MENVSLVVVYQDIKPEIKNVNELSGVLLKIKEDLEEEGKGFPKEVRILMDQCEWLSIVRSSKHDEAISLGFDTRNSRLATLTYLDYKWPFTVSILHN
jgi:hypothetical protein